MLFYMDGHGVRAACYARRSVEQHMAEDAKSTTRQVDLARAFAAERGWTTDPAHVYLDEAISGAEYVKRPAYLQMMSEARRTPRPWDAIVVMEQSRLGRDTGRVLLAIAELEESGIEVWSYQTRQRISVADESGEVNATVLALVDKLHRTQSSKRTREQKRSAVGKGYVTGSEAYGYRNAGPSGTKKRQVYEEEAQVVRRIFQLIAGGWGVRRVAREVGMSTTTVRWMLDNHLYRGVVIYGKTRKIDKGGTQKGVKIPESEWVRREDASLRIIPEALWDAAHARVEKTRLVYTGHRKQPGQHTEHLEAGLVSSHLLVGFLVCGGCRGRLTYLARPRKNGKVSRYYGCRAFYKAGRDCAGRVLVPYDAITNAILSNFEPARLEALFRKTFYEHPVPDWALKYDTQRPTAETDVKRLAGELVNLTDAVRVGGGDIRVIVAALRDTQRQLEEAQARLSLLNEPEGELTEEDMREIERELAELEAHSRPATLENCVTEGRTVLRQILTAPVTVTVARDTRGQKVGWDYAGTADLNGLFAGRVGRCPSVRGASARRTSGQRRPRLPVLLLQGRILRVAA